MHDEFSDKLNRAFKPLNPKPAFKAGDDVLANAIKRGAAELGVDPEDYATAMSYESAGSFDPWKAGPVTKWGQHRGTIQYGRPQREKYGVYEGQSAEEQITQSNVKYLKDAGVKPGMKFAQIYAAINGGSVRKSLDTQDWNTGRSIADNIRKADAEHREAVRKRFGSYFEPSADAPLKDLRSSFEAEVLGKRPKGALTTGTAPEPTFPGNTPPPKVTGLPAEQLAPLNPTFVKREPKPGENYFDFEITGRTGDLVYQGKEGEEHVAQNRDGDVFKLDPKAKKWKPVGPSKRAVDTEGGEYVLSGDQSGLKPGQVRRESNGLSFVFGEDGSIANETAQGVLTLLESKSAPLTQFPSERLKTFYDKERKARGLKDTEELRKKAVALEPKLKSGEATSIFTQAEDDLLARAQSGEGAAKEMTVTRTAAPQQTEIPQPDKGEFGTFLAEVDPEAEPGADPGQTVFRQAMTQLGRQVFGRELSTIELDALAAFQKKQRGAFVLDDKNNPTDARKGLYKVAAEHIPEYKAFLDANQEVFEQERLDRLQNYLAQGGELDEKARAEFRKLGLDDAKIDQALGYDPETSTYRGDTPLAQNVARLKEQFQGAVRQYAESPDEQTRNNALTYARFDMGWISAAQMADELQQYEQLKAEKRAEIAGLAQTQADPFTTPGRSMAMAGGRVAMTAGEQEAAVQDYLRQTITKYGSAANRNKAAKIEEMAELARQDRVASMSWPAYLTRSAAEFHKSLTKSALHILLSSTLRGISLGSKWINTAIEGQDATLDKIKGGDKGWAGPLADSIDHLLDTVMVSDKDMQKEFLAGKLPQGIGSTLGMLPGGFVSKAPRLGVAVLSALQMGGDGYAEALENGATEEQAQLAGMLMAPLGVTEIVGIGGALARLNSGASAGLWKRLWAESWRAGVREIPEEISQEGFQTTASNLITRLTYDPDRTWDKNVFDSMIVAGVSAPIASAGITALNFAKERMAIKKLIEQEQANGVVIQSYGGGEIYAFDQPVPVTPEIAPLVERHDFIRTQIEGLQGQIAEIEKQARGKSFEEKREAVKEVWDIKASINALRDMQTENSNAIIQQAGITPPEGTIADAIIPSEEEIVAEAAKPSPQTINESISPDEDAEIAEAGNLPIADEYVASNEILQPAASGDAETVLPSNEESQSAAQVTDNSGAGPLDDRSNATDPSGQPNNADENPPIIDTPASPRLPKALQLDDQRAAASFPEFAKERWGKNWYVSNRPLKKYEGTDARRVSHKEYKTAQEEWSGRSSSPKAGKPKYSNVQIQLAEKDRGPIQRFRQDFIKREDLADPADLPSYAKDALNIEPHITVKYGLKTNNPDDVRELLQDESPVGMKLGKVSVFPGAERGSYDVLIAEVDSPDLHGLNERITKGADVAPETHPEYKPHVTLAYLKKGAGAKYLKDNRIRENFIGTSPLAYDTVAFSPANKPGKVELPLGRRMPIDRSKPLEEQVKQAQTLSAENKPIIKRILSRFENQLGLEGGKDNEKSPESIAAKATRPSKLAKSPSYGVDHLRDAYRFKAAINNFDDFRQIARVINEEGLEIIKVDTEKMFEPDIWGWSMVALDLKAPNGQLIEFYTSFPEVLAANKAGNHAIFEKWRNATGEEIAERIFEFDEDRQKSWDAYQTAFDSALEEMGFESREEARASFNKAVRSLSSMTAFKVSETSEPKAPSDQTPSDDRTNDLTSGGSVITQAKPADSSLETDANIPKGNISQIGPDSGKQESAQPSGLAGAVSETAEPSAADLIRGGIAAMLDNEAKSPSNDDDSDPFNFDDVSFKSVLQQPAPEFKQHVYESLVPRFRQALSTLTETEPQAAAVAFVARLRESSSVETVLQLEPYMVNLFDEYVLQPKEEETAGVPREQEEDTERADSPAARKLTEEEMSPEDMLTVGRMRELADAPLETVLDSTEFEQNADRIFLGAGSHELFRRTIEQVRFESGQLDLSKAEDTEDLFKGQFIPPTTVNKMIRVLRTKAQEAIDKGYGTKFRDALTRHADALQSAKQTNGTVVLYVFPSAVPEELFHQADYLGAVEKNILNRHSSEAKKKLDAHRIRQVLWERHFSKFGEYRRREGANREAVLRAEIPPYLLELSDTQLADIGITEEERKDYLLTWFEGYVEKNGIEALDNFDNEEINVQEFIAHFKEAYKANQDGQSRQQNESDSRASEGTTNGSDGRGNQRSDASGYTPDAAKFFGLGENQKYTSLPATMRRAGLDMDDMPYEVFGDRAATEQARELINENGIEGTIKLLDNVGQLDVHHALASFMIQRMLMNRAAELDATDPQAAEQIRAYGRSVGRKHVLNSVASGRFTRAASIIPHTTEGVVFAFQGIVEEKWHGQQDLSPEQWVEIEAMGRDLEEKTEKLQATLKEKSRLERQVKRLQDELDGKKKSKRRKSSSLKGRKRLVAKVKEEKQANVDKVRTRLQERFKAISESRADAVQMTADEGALKSALEPDEDFPLDDFAEVGAMMLMEGIAGDVPYLPEDFKAEMLADYGDAIQPYFDQIYKAAWEKRDDWLREMRADDTAEAIRGKYGEDLTDDEVDEILGERKEAARRRRAIESIHKLVSHGRRPKSGLDEMERIIADISTSNGIAVITTVLYNNGTVNKIREAFEELGITDEKKRREILRDADKTLVEAKKRHAIEKDEIANELLATQKQLSQIDDIRWQDREAMRKSARNIADTMRRIKTGELKYAGGKVLEALNVPRTMMASLDMSAGLRQGGFFTFAKPEAQGQAFFSMIKSLSPEQYGREIMTIEAHPLFSLMQRAGVDFAAAGRTEKDADITAGEELFRGEEMVEKIPLLGKAVAELVIKPSERTYTAMLDKQRAIMTGIFFQELMSRGFTYQTHPEQFRQIADFVNIATGRGKMGSARLAKVLMNLPLFAPRYTLSRLQLINMTLNPVAYYNMPAGTRKIIGKQAFRFYGTTMGVLGLVTAFGAMIGANVNWDPDDSDFLKIKIGNTHYDIFSGLLPTAKLLVKIGMSGYRTKLGTDNRIEGEFGWDIYNAVGRFLRGKLSPLTSLGVDAALGTDYIGNKTELWGDAWYKPGKAIYSRLIPLTVGDALEAHKLDGWIGVAKSTPFAFFGLGVSTYKPRPEQAETEAEKLFSKMASWGFKGKGKEKEVRDLKADLVARSRKGENVEAEIQAGIEAGMIDEYTERDIRSAADKTLLVDKAEGLSLDQIYEGMRIATPAEREQLIPLLNKKMKEADVDEKLKPEMRNKLEALGARVLGDAPMPDAVKAEFRRFKIKTPDVGESLTPKKGQGSVKLDNAQYDKYRREALTLIYQRVNELVTDPEYKTWDAAEQERMLRRTINKARAAESKETKRELEEDDD